MNTFQHIFIPGDAAGALVLLHGTGGDERDLVPLANALSPGAALLGVRGNVLENGAPRFFKRLREGVFDLEDLRVQSEALASFLMSAKSEYGLDSLTAVGFSNGANIAASILLRDPNVFQRAVLFRAMTPFIPDSLPRLEGTPTLIISGKLDPIVPEPDVTRLAAMLGEAGATVSHRWINAGHGLTNEDVALATAWLSSSR